MQLTSDFAWPWPLVLLMAAGLFAFSWWTYLPGTPRRRTLLTLRALAIALLFLTLARPNFVYQRDLPQSSRLVVMADKSESMTLRDMWNGQSRAAVLREILRDSEDEFEDLAEKVQVSRYEFDRELRDGLDPDAEPVGKQTALGDSLQQLLQELAGERIAGIIILGDGRNTTGVPPERVARQLGVQRVPLHTVGLGAEVAQEREKDIAATGLVVNDQANVQNQLPVRAEFTGTGFAQKEVPVRVLLDGVVKETTSVRFDERTGKGIVNVKVTPENAGDVKLTVLAEPQTGELLPGNNGVSTYVTVRSDTLKVLYVEGKYRAWEPKFLRWALDRSPDIALRELVLLDRDGKAEPIPPEALQRANTDVVILGDVAAAAFSRGELEAMRRLVDAGAGLVMIGGYEAFGPGGWSGTPVGELLPVSMSPADGQLQEAVPLRPTQAGLDHFILQLGGDRAETERVWAGLRPLDGASTFRGLKAGGLLLAESDAGVPLLVAQDLGDTRSIAFAGDTTWLWRTGGEAGVRAHARFWRQLMLWVSRRDQQGDAEVRVRLADRRVALGQKLSADVQVVAADGTPETNVQVRATVRGPGGSEADAVMVRQGDGFTTDFWETGAVGDYELEVVAVQDGKKLGSKSRRFLVYAEDAEMRQLAADLEGLKALSAATEGQVVDPRRFEQFVASLKEQDLNQEVTTPVYVSLWDRYEVLALFLVLLAAEWIIRKQAGLP